jgi:F-type H+-transporting ATPase subunit gamma
MGAAGLIDIKRRLKSVEGTKKITKAMGLVATSKLRKSRKELRVNEDFASIAKRNMEIISSIAEGEIQDQYVKNNSDNLVLYVAIFSDSGLCGGYNNNVVSYINSTEGSSKKNIGVISLGSKGISYLKRSDINILDEYVDIPDIPTIKDVDIIYKKIIKLCTEHNISKVKVVYTEFHSPVKYVVKCEQLLPVEKVKSEVRAELIEPNVEIVYKQAFDMYLKGKLRSCLLSSKCSEQSSRMAAMNGATSNAEDIISALNISYNRIRQAVITQEISEIVGGAEAQK